MKNETEILQDIRERLQDRFSVREMVLFGSRAKGTAHAESDYDVLVIADTDIPFVERQGLALLALGRRQYALDLLVYTPQEIEAQAAIPGSAVYWAIREGKRVHAL